MSGDDSTRTDMYEHRRTPTNIGGHLRTSADTYEHRRTPTKACEHLRRPANIYEDPRSSSEVFERLRRPSQVHETLRLCLRTRRVHRRHHGHLPRSHTTPTKSCEVPRSISEYLRAGFGASPRPRTIPQYLGIVPFDHRTFLAAFSAVFGSSVMLVAACVHYRLHWDAGVYIVEYQYPGLSVARPFLLS
jgi:hypothetical protein